MMGPYLPPEILDNITDLLHSEPKALRNCCLVSKSWVPRTRKHIFFDISFPSSGKITRWKKTFPDPANSPAYHVRTLFFGCPEAIEEADVEELEGGWIQSFSHIEELRVSDMNYAPAKSFSLDLFHKSSPSLKSLRVFSTALPLSQILNFVCSLPLLEDLALTVYDRFAISGDELTPAFSPSTSPPLTGTLEFPLQRGMTDAARRLLDLPNGLRFRKFDLIWRDEEDLRWTEKLVVACSNTLEYLDISQGWGGEPARPGPLDLSEAKKLKDVVFRCGPSSNEWVTKTLETITSRHQNLQRISIHLPQIFHQITREDGVTEWAIRIDFGIQWLDLDNLLVQFWESRSIRPKVVYPLTNDRKEEMRNGTGHLLPEVTKRGIVDLVESQ